MEVRDRDAHSLAVGRVLWIFGFLGAHRFYFGRPVSGTIYLFTLGLLLIGWMVDLFRMPALERSADRRYLSGPKHCTLTWVLPTFTGVFGLQRITIFGYARLVGCRCHLPLLETQRANQCRKPPRAVR
jgi:TM2 domain-containing membrane protein YozV